MEKNGTKKVKNLKFWLNDVINYRKNYELLNFYLLIWYIVKKYDFILNLANMYAISDEKMHKKWKNGPKMPKNGIFLTFFVIFFPKTEFSWKIVLYQPIGIQTLRNKKVIPEQSNDGPEPLPKIYLCAVPKRISE